MLNKRRTRGEQAGQPQVNQAILTLSKYSPFGCSAFVKYLYRKYFKIKKEIKKNINIKNIYHNVKSQKAGQPKRSILTLPIVSPVALLVALLKFTTIITTKIIVLDNYIFLYYNINAIKNNKKKRKEAIKMPKLTIELSDNTHQILKELAKKDRRSLTNYICVTLEDHANANEKKVFSSENTENSGEKNVNTINSTTNLPQQQKIRKNVVVGAEFDEELQEARSKWM